MRFFIYKSGKTGHYWFVIKGANVEMVVTSETYFRKQSEGAPEWYDGWYDAFRDAAARPLRGRSSRLKSVARPEGFEPPTY